MINGNARLTLREIEIKDASEWSQVRLSNFKLRVGNRLDQVLSHSSLHSQDEKPPVVTQKINANTSVTLHRYADFLRIYDLFHIDIGIIESSLLPERNREQVFHAGEGSGKSGSFFFFSHD